MNTASATIRELRTDFRGVKRKVEQHGEVIITDNGAPAYTIKAVPAKASGKRRPMPDYLARLKQRQPKPMSEAAARQLWDYERGDR
jgi:antitoxin (DNA-binding transcriptional repressor) of toxin-antitoxin stability system